MTFQVNLSNYVGSTRKYLPPAIWLELMQAERQKHLSLDAVETLWYGGPTNILRLT
jgi:hypothetical protein